MIVNGEIWYTSRRHACLVAFLDQGDVSHPRISPGVSNHTHAEDTRCHECWDSVHLPNRMQTIEASELEEIKIPVSLKSYATGPCHGVAFWFDVTFPGASQAVVLSTAPGLPTTHWYQLRCVFQRPGGGLLVRAVVILLFPI